VTEAGWPAGTARGAVPGHPDRRSRSATEGCGCCISPRHRALNQADLPLGGYATRDDFLSSVSFARPAGDPSPAAFGSDGDVKVLIRFPATLTLLFDPHRGWESSWPSAVLPCPMYDGAGQVGVPGGDPVRPRPLRDLFVRGMGVVGRQGDLLEVVPAGRACGGVADLPACLPACPVSTPRTPRPAGQGR
jgi:hypothetical protein